MDNEEAVEKDHLMSLQVKQAKTSIWHYWNQRDKNCFIAEALLAMTKSRVFQQPANVFAAAHNNSPQKLRS